MNYFLRLSTPSFTASKASSALSFTASVASTTLSLALPKKFCALPSASRLLSPVTLPSTSFALPAILSLALSNFSSSVIINSPCNFI